MPVMKDAISHIRRIAVTSDIKIFGEAEADPGDLATLPGTD